MKIQYCSDLHLEFEENRHFLKTHPLCADGDILVIAGDVCHLNDEALSGLEFLKWASDNYSHVLMTPGNHEFYHQGDLGAYSGSWEEMLFPNLGYFNNKVVMIDNIDFILSTLWSKIPKEKEEDILYGMNDYFQILFNGDPLHPTHINKEFESSISFIKQSVNESTAEKIVIVTHHLPTFEALLGRRQDDVLNSAYATELSDYIKHSRITAWIYGHSHYDTDLIIGNTRLISNPLGYVRYGQHLDFNNSAFIEI